MALGRVGNITHHIGEFLMAYFVSLKLNAENRQDRDAVLFLPLEELQSACRVSVATLGAFGDRLHTDVRRIFRIAVTEQGAHRGSLSLVYHVCQDVRCAGTFLALTPKWRTEWHA